MDHGQSLPYASSLCGACYEVCPVKINIPEVLIYLRSRVVQKNGRGLRNAIDQERVAMKMMSRIFLSRSRFETGQRAARLMQRPFVGKDGWIHRLPGMAGRWTVARDLPAVPSQTFREWWQDQEHEREESE
jgi:L-lactate dehydrogenase complex protein LldF